MKTFNKRVDILSAFATEMLPTYNIDIINAFNEQYALLYKWKYEDGSTIIHGPFFCEENQEVVLLIIQKTNSR